MSVILIRNGHLIDPAANLDGLRDVVLRDGRVAEVAAAGKAKVGPEAQIIEAKGLTVAPGLVDIHVHLREPGVQGDDCYRNGGGGGGWVYLRCGYAEHDSNQRFAGDYAVDAGSGTWGFGAGFPDRGGYARTEGGCAE